MTPRPRMTGFLECVGSDGKSYALPDLYCPFGHKIPWEFAFHEAGYPRCVEENSSGHRICSARLFVHFFPRINPNALPLMYVAEVSYEEIMHVTKTGMDVPAIMAYLGVTWKPERRAG